MIITLCGSLRFEEEFKKWDERLTFAGHTVFTVSVYPSDKIEKNWYTEEQKIKLDFAHKRKILASDGILVINPGAYIGESTASEIAYARFHNKQVKFTCPSQEMAHNERQACPYAGCYDPYIKYPPCTLCYE